MTLLHSFAMDALALLMTLLRFYLLSFCVPNDVFSAPNDILTDAHDAFSCSVSILTRMSFKHDSHLFQKLYQVTFHDEINFVDNLKKYRHKQLL